MSTIVARSLQSVADLSADQNPMPTPTETDERAVIGAAILARDDIRAVMLGSYRPTDLTDARCRYVDDLLRRMQAGGVPVDQVTVVQFARRHGLLADGAPRIALGTWLAETVAAAPVPMSGTWYAAAVVETAARHTVRAVGEELDRVADTASVVQLELIIEEQIRVLTAAVARIKAAVA